MEQRILRIIDENRDVILAFARDIYRHAELGYKERRTAEKFCQALESLGIGSIQTGLALTGVKGYLEAERKTGPTLALIGELDALRIPNHACAWSETGAAHCCGHHAQLAGVVGAAFALADPAVRGTLDGNVVFFGVPAEEYGEIEFKNALRDAGEIRYGGGKCELIRTGAFDDIDLSLVHHSSPQGISVGNGSSNGFVSKVVRYRGRASHAAGSPHTGVNALYAANLGLTALQHQRETFRDEDTVRVHPILTRGGDLVNVIPEEAVVETLVRAKTVEAILDADRKTDRALKAGAEAMGAGYRLETMCGYLPQLPGEAHPDLLAAAELAAGDRPVRRVQPGEHGTGSTDVGDLQHIQPVLSFQTGGMAGELHSSLFDIVDEEEAYLITAKIFALSAYRLLREGAGAAKQVVESYKPPFTKGSYVDFMESLMRTEEKEVSDR